MEDKQKTIGNEYHHSILGDGSIKYVYKESTSTTKHITVNGVRDYFSKLQSRQVQFQKNETIHS